MTLTVNQVVASVRSRLDEVTVATWTDTEIKRWTNEALRDLARTALKRADIKGKPYENAIVDAFAIRDPDADPVTDSKGNVIALRVNDPAGDLDLVNGGYIGDGVPAAKYSCRNLLPRWEVDGPGSGWWIDFA